jgi:16S rRNA (guanine527-N7)-methyltransferase
LETIGLHVGLEAQVEKLVGLPHPRWRRCVSGITQFHVKREQRNAMTGAREGESAIDAALTRATHDVCLGRDCLAKLAAHWRLVVAWNRRTNLTTLTNPEEAAWFHYRDSLEALPFLPQGPIADIGSGAGFPGVPLAIASPERRFTLVETRRKRASFLATAAARLGLENAKVLQARSDELPRESWGAVVTRATFSRETDLLACLELLESGGVLIAFRGSEAPLLPDSERHQYEIQSVPRVLEIIRK